MIRVNWQEMYNIHDKLSLKGFTPNTNIIIHVYLLNEDGHTETQTSAKTKFKEWLLKLYEVQGNRRVMSVVITDEQSRVIWKTRTSVVECNQNKQDLPVTGHEHIFRDFAAMDTKQKDVWVELVLASLMEYIDYDNGNDKA